MAKVKARDDAQETVSMEDVVADIRELTGRLAKLEGSSLGPARGLSRDKMLEAMLQALTGSDGVPPELRQSLNNWVAGHIRSNMGNNAIQTAIREQIAAHLANTQGTNTAMEQFIQGIVAKTPIPAGNIREFSHHVASYVASTLQNKRYRIYPE